MGFGFAFGPALLVGAEQDVRYSPRRPAAAEVEAPISPAVAPESAAVPPSAVSPAPEPAQPAPAPTPDGSPVDKYPRPVNSWLEAQIELSRCGFSCGPIDGIEGVQTAAALRAFQEKYNLSPTEQLDLPTRARLLLESAPLSQRAVSVADLAQLQPLSATWLGKSQQTTLAYETPLELVAERFHSHPSLIRQLNPGVDWNAFGAETPVNVPAVERISIGARLERVAIRLTDHVLEGFDPAGRVIVHFPVSIARAVEKRPVGELHVTVVISNPDYTFDPEVFPESAEARELGRKLLIPPGPNNPVGIAWVGLDRPGYGIHGTPGPEQVGRTESHGCFRLANWDAATLLDLAWVGLPVTVEP
jgi:lipoprotein-anchoring transpeptidase ErfK/SrfK